IPVVGSAGTVSLLGAQEYLRALRDAWQDHTICLGMIRDILLYMDRVYVKNTNKPYVYDLGMDLFRDNVLRSTKFPIKQKTVETVLHQIFVEREGEVIDRGVMKSVTDMMVNLNAPVGRPTTTSSSSSSTTSNSATLSGPHTVYDLDIEQDLLKSTREYYTRESELIVRSYDAREFLVKVERRLSEEEQRCRHYLGAGTEGKVRIILEEVLIERNVKAVIEMENSGLVPMLTHERTEDLSRMYKLFARVKNGHVEMRNGISELIKNLGRTINETVGGVQSDGSGTTNHSTSTEDADGDGEKEKDKGKASTIETTGTTTTTTTPPPNPIKWVESLLELKDKFDKVLESSFGKDKAFVNEVNDALTKVVNLNLRAPEFLSLFIDENLKKGIKGKSEAEVDSILEKTIVLFRFIAEKDVFERYYKQHLAKRLLFGRSSSEDAEKNFIAKLKLECGSQFTSKLEGMFNDMRVSQDTMTSFRTHLQNSTSTTEEDTTTANTDIPEISVNVLTSTFWPLSTSQPCNYPPQITKCMDRFQRFYLSRHSGRRLQWLPHMGTADIRAHFAKGRKEINVNTFGMIVLVGVFNDEQAWGGASVGFDRIMEVTGLPVSELKRTLQGLSLGKHRILVKGSKGKEVLESDTFALNVSFSSPLNKIKILTIAGSAGGSGGGGAAENDQERGDTMERVDEARKHQIEAAIVRIMKSRKRMEHNVLVGEVIGQLVGRFAPNPGMVKKRIEGLIEREYLERDGKDRKVYNYLA
ncbi:Cullin-3, partial [Blyttiomyces sp. JEL0837]